MRSGQERRFRATPPALLAVGEKFQKDIGGSGVRLHGHFKEGGVLPPAWRASNVPRNRPRSA
jgi:hypothetical protein